MKALFLTLLTFMSLTVSADSWVYQSHGGQHLMLILQERGDGGFSISGHLNYTDGLNYNRAYKWEGQLDLLPEIQDRNTVKYTVKNAVINFDSADQVCSVPIDVILYLPRKSRRLNNFYIESRIPVQSVLPLKGRTQCAEPQYFRIQDPLPYWSPGSSR